MKPILNGTCAKGTRF